MKVINTNIDGLYIFEPKVFEDSRGHFFESFNKKIVNRTIENVSFTQDNESKSRRGVLRGLHFQIPPYDQSKLVRCIKGKILDVAVDIRKSSNTYGKHFSIILSGKNKKQIFIPKGFAHGFIVLSQEAIVNYKVDNPYNPKYDSGIIWNDPSLSIDWIFNEKEIIISSKDKKLTSFKNLNLY